MANQTYTLVITGNLAGQFVQNIFHYRMDDDSFTNRLLAAKGLIDGFLAAGKHSFFFAMVPDAYTCASIKARRATNGGGPEWIDVSEQGEEGNFGSDINASANGPVIIWNTDGGPRRVGKTFLPGISPEKQNAGEIADAAIASLLASAEDFRDPFPAVGGTAPTVTFCIPRHNDLSTRSLVVGSQVSKHLGNQRRRQLPV